MGNCLRNNKVSAQDDLPRESGKPEEAVEQMKTCASSKLKTASHVESVEKMARFKLQEDDSGGRGSCGDCTRSGPVRIRLIVTQEEFQRMMSLTKNPQCTTLEQLLGAMKLNGRRMCEVGENEGVVNPWRPALESIPEDESMK